MWKKVLRGIKSAGACKNVKEDQDGLIERQYCNKESHELHGYLGEERCSREKGHPKCLRLKTLRRWKIRLQMASQGPDLKSRAEIPLRFLCMPGGYKASWQWALGQERA